MPIVTAPAAAAPPIVGLVAAQPGCTAALGPVAGPVVAWALVADVTAPGGGRVDPVFIVGGRTWTPDQYRASTNTHSAVIITAP